MATERATIAGATRSTQGVLQADRGVGLSPNSGLILNGGVLQSNSAVAFTDGLYWGTGETGYSFTWASGGFSAGGGKMTVNIAGGITTLNFGDVDGRAGIAGIMKLSSTSAQYETEIQNPVNLNGGARTIQVDDNPNSTGDFASLSGVISDSVGSGSLIKTGRERSISKARRRTLILAPQRSRAPLYWRKPAAPSPSPAISLSAKPATAPPRSCNSMGTTRSPLPAS